MKYYKLAHDNSEKGVGPYPQSTGMSKDYPYKAKDSIWYVDFDTTIVPNLNAIKLSKGAKLTDMLSVVVIYDMIGKIVSEDFKMLLEDFELPPHYFFPAKIIDHRNRPVIEKKYFLFRLREHQNRQINFERSEFYIHRRGAGEVNTFDTSDAANIEKTSGELGLGIGEYIKPKFITLFPDFDYDIFAFKRFTGFYISEKLKLAIQSNRLTGIRFESADFILQEEVLSFKQ